jgi:hypothetical protein
MDLGKDIDLAVKITWRVFTEVYNLDSSFNLKIDEN